MISARSKRLFSLLLAGAIFLSPQVFAAEGESSSESSKADLDEIKTRLDTLDQQEKQILANQDKIFEKLDQLRIWVHRK